MSLEVSPQLARDTDGSVAEARRLWKALDRPNATVRLFEDHGRVWRTLGEDDATKARRVMKALADGGIDFADVNHTLEEAGIEKFIKSLDSLLDVIAGKRRALRGSWTSATLSTCLYVLMPNRPGDDTRTLRISCRTRQ